MPTKDYYRILGVAPGADATAIKKAYRRLARAWHPDRNAETCAEEHFKEIAEAYAVLGDPDQRAIYDQLCGHGPGGFDTAAFETWFSHIFGSGGEPTGRDVQVELPLTLEQAHRGGRHRLQLRPAGGAVRWVTLPPCRDPDAVIRLAGQGWPGRGGAGDLLIAIRLQPHPLFRWQGGRLVHELVLPPWDAALGVRTVVPTLAGPVALQVPANSRSGSRLRLAGKGLAGGDLIVVLKVDNPTVETPEQREAYQALRRQFGAA